MQPRSGLVIGQIIIRLQPCKRQNTQCDCLLSFCSNVPMCGRASPLLTPVQHPKENNKGERVIKRGYAFVFYQNVCIVVVRGSVLLAASTVAFGATFATQTGKTGQTLFSLFDVGAVYIVRKPLRN